MVVRAQNKIYIYLLFRIIRDMQNNNDSDSIWVGETKCKMSYSLGRYSNNKYIKLNCYIQISTL